MAKTVNKNDISLKLARHRELLVKRCVEKTKEYDTEIAQLEKEIDFFYYGV